MFALPETSMKLEVLCRCFWVSLQESKEHENKTRGCLDEDTTKLVLVESFCQQEGYLSLGNR